MAGRLTAILCCLLCAFQANAQTATPKVRLANVVSTNNVHYLGHEVFLEDITKNTKLIPEQADCEVVSYQISISLCSGSYGPKTVECDTIPQDIKKIVHRYVFIESIKLKCNGTYFVAEPLIFFLKKGPQVSRPCSETQNR